MTSLADAKWLGVIVGATSGFFELNWTVRLLSGRTSNGNKLNPDESAFFTWLPKIRNYINSSITDITSLSFNDFNVTQDSTVLSLNSTLNAH